MKKYQEVIEFALCLIAMFALQLVPRSGLPLNAKILYWTVYAVLVFYMFRSAIQDWRAAKAQPKDDQEYIHIHLTWPMATAFVAAVFACIALLWHVLQR